MSGGQQAQAIPENRRAKPGYSAITPFLDGDGLHIVEPTVPTENGEPAGKVVKLASWQDPDAPGWARWIISSRRDSAGRNRSGQSQSV